jgi:hypothetical protein
MTKANMRMTTSYNYRLRVVVYYFNGDTWSTYVFDGRDVGANDSADGLRVQFLDGMVPITGRERSFRLHYDGEHYEHLTFCLCSVDLFINVDVSKVILNIFIALLTFQMATSLILSCHDPRGWHAMQI